LKANIMYITYCSATLEA